MRRIVSIVGFILLTISVLALFLTDPTLMGDPAAHQQAPCGRLDTTPPALSDTEGLNVPGATLQFYEVCGSSVAELRASMHRFGPITNSGKHQGKRPAKFAWYITWHTESNADETCHATSVTPQMTVILPHWSPPAGASPALVSAWNRYLLDVTNQFVIYADIVQANVPNVAKAIESGSCDNANAAARTVLTQIQQQADAYHEQIEGVGFHDPNIWTWLVLPMGVALLGVFNSLNLVWFLVSRIRRRMGRPSDLLPPAPSAESEPGESVPVADA